MNIVKYFKLKNLIQWTVRETSIFIIIAFIPTYLYEILDYKWLTIPWLPVAMIGTAVAFIIGFKNNASYDRLWEARKIWGAIVNSSRTWGMIVRDFVTNADAIHPLSENELKSIHIRLIYRHIAWLTALRFQLRQPRGWEHFNEAHVKRFRNLYSIPELENDLDDELNRYLSPDELTYVRKKKNSATHIISLQSKELKELFNTKLIDNFRFIILEKKLADFYDQQGQCERIKTFPYPRQYATFNLIFVWIFILLVPLGMLEEFKKMGDLFVWITIPFSVLVSWVIHTMAKVGDSTENPFEGGANDIPMAAICRTIEIDLRDMLDETKLPEPVQAVNNILM